MKRVAAPIACVLALAAAGTANASTQSEFTGHHRQIFRVVVVPSLTRADLPALARRGAAVGLLVPNAGPTTSAGDAFAGMVRGILYNARLARPRDAVLIRVVRSDKAPVRGPAIVLALPPQHEVDNTRRYPIAVLGPGYHGVLVSKLTRVPGLVSMADVARTALGTQYRLRSQSSADPAAALTRLEARIVSSRGSTMAASVLVLSLLVFFALLYPSGAAAALAAALLANLGLGWFGGSGAAVDVVIVGLCLVGGGLAGPRLLRSRLALGTALAAVIAAYGLAMLVHPPALSLAPMGPELTSRFFGVSNLVETLLLGPALLAGRLLGERFGPVAYAGVGLLTLVTIGENRLGSDGGGAIVVGVAFAVLAAGMWARSKLQVVPALALAGLVAFVLVDIDAASSSPDHLRGALHDGFHGLVRVAANRVPLSYSRILHQWWLAFPGIPALGVGAAAIRHARSRADAALVVSLLCALGTSLLVNDSPGAVAIAGLASLLALEGGLVHRGLALPIVRRLRVSAPVTVPPAAALPAPVAVPVSASVAGPGPQE
jgi:hypothetical protein